MHAPFFVELVQDVPRVSIQIQGRELLYSEHIYLLLLQLVANRTDADPVTDLFEVILVHQLTFHAE